MGGASYHGNCHTQPSGSSLLPGDRLVNRHQHTTEQAVVKPVPVSPPVLLSVAFILFKGSLCSIENLGAGFMNGEALGKGNLRITCTHNFPSIA